MLIYGASVLCMFSNPHNYEVTKLGAVCTYIGESLPTIVVLKKTS